MRKQLLLHVLLRVLTLCCCLQHSMQQQEIGTLIIDASAHVFPTTASDHFLPHTETFQDPSTNNVYIENGAWTRLQMTIAYSTNLTERFTPSIRHNSGCPHNADKLKLPFKVYLSEDTDCPVQFYQEQRYSDTRCDKLVMLVQGTPELNGYEIQFCLNTLFPTSIYPVESNLSRNYTISIREYKLTFHSCNLRTYMYPSKYVQLSFEISPLNNYWHHYFFYITPQQHPLQWTQHNPLLHHKTPCNRAPF